MKELILKEIYKGVKKLETFAILDVPDDVFSKATSIVAAAEKVGIEIGWLDNWRHMRQEGSFYFSTEETATFCSIC